MSKIDPLTHVMNVKDAMKDPEERKKLIEPINFERPFNHACRLVKKGRISLLIADKAGRGKSTFLFTILAKGPLPTFERRKLKAPEEIPECLASPDVLEKIVSYPRAFYKSEELNSLSKEELYKIFEEHKYIIIDDIHFLNLEALSVLKDVLESDPELNIIATMVPKSSEEEEEKAVAPHDILSQVADRFSTTSKIDPMDPQALKRILRKRLLYALGGEDIDKEILSTVESITYTISFFTGALGGEIVVRRGIVLLKEYLHGELLRDFEMIMQNMLEGVNVRATMIPHTILTRNIKDRRISFQEIRLTSEGISLTPISLEEPAAVGTVNYSSKPAQIRFYGIIGGKLQSRRRIQVPDIIMKHVVLDPEILILNVETNLTSSVLHPDIPPPIGLLDKFSDLMRDKYYEIEDSGKKINKPMIIHTYHAITREVRKRPEVKEYIAALREKLGYGNYDLAMNRLIIYRSLKAMAEIFPSK